MSDRPAFCDHSILVDRHIPVGLGNPKEPSGEKARPEIGGASGEACEVACVQDL
jgi:hypothetical protein